ncbi:MAG: hypothetical protein AAF493_04400 [Pseudomonadota bacterium]
MNRRQLLATSLGVAVAAALPAVTAGENHVPYSRAAYDDALASGKPFMLDFYASW